MDNFIHAFRDVRKERHSIMSTNDNKKDFLLSTHLRPSKTNNKKDILLSTLLAADALVTSVAGAKLFQNLATKVAKNGLDLAKVKSAGAGVGMGICSGLLLAGDFIPTLAQAIDRAWTKKEDVAEEEIEEVAEEVEEEGYLKL